MKLAIALATVLAITVAKPETYKEKEDFQYSRSSSDEGTKSGYYGAQRGNMGGNYEKAHNMDPLAQHQLSGVVRQVDTEHGDAYNSKTGSVFTSANTRGIYGAGYSDLSNLQGRDFREGISHTDSTSSLLHSNDRYSHNSGYHSQYQDSNQHAAGRYYGQNYDGSLATIASENLGSGSYGQAGQSSQYHRQSGYNSEAGYHGSYAQNHEASAYGSNANHNTRIINLKPVRVVVRPGGRVAIPVAAQTYDTKHTDSSSLYENTYNINSEAADLNSIDTAAVTPSAGKHYESSYKYHKEWEKHDTQPSAVSLSVPLTSGTAYVDNSNYHADQESNSRSAYNVKSSAQSHRQSNYNAHNYGSNSINSDAYKVNDQYSKVNDDALTEVLGSNKPKSYQSSYSYHKSWERQGDPYVIKPVSSNTNHETSQRLYSTDHLYQNADCCNIDQRIRSRRSIGQEQEDLGQQTQNLENFDQFSQNLQDFGQQNQNLEDLGQQTQNLEDFGQQNQNLEDLGQQTQNLETFGQQSQNQNLEDLGQQTQNLETFGQQTQNQNLEDFGQQTQNLEEFGQQTQNQNLENLGQKPLSQNLEDLGQQVQSQDLQDFRQNTQNQWNRWENLGQQEQIKYRKRRDNFEQLGQQTKENWKQFKAEGNWANKEALSQKTKNDWSNAKTQHRRRRDTDDWQHFKELGQQTNNNWKQFRTEGKWENAEALRQKTEKDWQEAREKYGEHKHNDKQHKY